MVGFLYLIALTGKMSRSTFWKISFTLVNCGFPKASEVLAIIGAIVRVHVATASQRCGGAALGLHVADLIFWLSGLQHDSSHLQLP